MILKSNVHFEFAGNQQISQMDAIISSAQTTTFQTPAEQMFPSRSLMTVSVNVPYALCWDGMVMVVAIK